MPFDCHDAMVLIVAAIVGLMDLAHQENVTMTSWLCLILSAEIGGEVSFSVVCTLAPY